MKNLKINELGITLVGLVVTIIILLILAGISIASLTNNGIFEKARLAEQESKNAQEKEEGILGDYENKISEYIDSSRDTVSYCTNPAGTTSTASPSSPCVVVENYRNGTEWYRLWSDGWIEQGGHSVGGASAAGSAINLIKAFSDTNYTLTTSDIFNPSNNGGAYALVVTQKNTQNFYISAGYYQGYAAYPFDWYACGY